MLFALFVELGSRSEGPWYLRIWRGIGERAEESGGKSNRKKWTCYSRDSR